MREELFHPMFAHFPIVLFVLALIFKALELALSKQRELSEKMNFICRICLFSGPLFFLVTMYLGDIALDAIKKDFCQLKLLYDHEDMAKTALSLVIFANGLESISKLEKLKQKWRKILSVMTLIVLLLLNIEILKTAHSGATLVYENGAAVKGAVKNCR